MPRRPTYVEMSKVDRLQYAVRRIDKQLGYKEVTISNGTRYEVFGSPLGQNSPGSRYKKVVVTGEGLLKEMENLALHYRITPQRVYAEKSAEPPDWLHRDGKEFWNCVRRRETVRGLPIALGVQVKRFGPQIRFLLSLKDTFRPSEDQIRLETREHQTQEQIVYADVRSGEIRLEAYRYCSTDKTKYENNLKYEAAMDFNRSMYTYVELRKMAPSNAYQKWISDNRRYHQAVLTLIAVSFAGP